MKYISWIYPKIYYFFVEGINLFWGNSSITVVLQYKFIIPNVYNDGFLLCTVIPVEVIQFWIPPTPREIRLKKLNVSHNLYCNVLSLIVYFVGKLMY